jgi:hypothetical protein
VLVAYLAGGFVIPYTIHAIFLLCLAILPFDLNWLPDTRIFRSALGGFLAVWLPVLVAPSHKRRVAVGALVFIVAGFWLLVLVAYLAGGFVIPYTIHAIFLLSVPWRGWI